MELKLGFGRVEFSPDGNVSMNSTLTGTYLAEPLFASCLAWQEGEETILQFSLDLRGNYDPFRLPLIEKVTAATGIPADHILVSVTHNHSCPDVNLLGRPEITDWVQRIGYPAMVQAAVDALADLTPVLGASAGKATTYKCAFVRRYFREDGTLAGIASQKNPSPRVRHESEADPELRAVRIQREGKKDVVLVNFQTHAATALTQYKDRICADFLGKMREVIESEEDVLSIYFQGACGNVNTLTSLEWEKEGWPGDYAKTGESIGRSTLEALKTAQPLKIGGLKINWDSLTCFVDHKKSHLAETAREIARESDPEKKAQRMEEAGISSRYELGAIITRAAFGPTREMPLATLVCGELAMGFAPVELFDTCGKSFREASPYGMTFFVGYSNGSHSYMPSAMAFPNGGYEVLQCHYVPGTGEMIALNLASQLNTLKKNG